MDSHFFSNNNIGSGKTTVLRNIIARYRAFNAAGHAELDDNARRIVLCCAPTGVAAQLLFRGATLHSLFGLPFDMPTDIRRVVEDHINSAIGEQTASAELLRTCSLIVIDEISMMTHVMLKYLDVILQKFRCNNLVMHFIFSTHTSAFWWCVHSFRRGFFADPVCYYRFGLRS